MKEPDDDPEGPSSPDATGFHDVIILRTDEMGRVGMLDPQPNKTISRQVEQQATGG